MSSQHPTPHFLQSVGGAARKITRGAAGAVGRGSDPRQGANVTQAAQPARPRRMTVVLDPRDALAENGFTVFRKLFSAAECAELAQHSVRRQASRTGSN